MTDTEENNSLTNNVILLSKRLTEISTLLQKISKDMTKGMKLNTRERTCKKVTCDICNVEVSSMRQHKKTKKHQQSEEFINMFTKTDKEKSQSTVTIMEET